MSKRIVSTFKQSPATKTGKAAFILSIISICTGPILGISAAVILPLLSDNISEMVGQIAGFSLMILLAFALIAMLVCSVKAFAIGERSWAVMIALALSILSVLFWAFMIVCELLMPH